MSSLQKALVNEKKSSLQHALVREMSSGRRKKPPTVSTAHGSSLDDDDSSSCSDESNTGNEQIESQDMMKIRQQAIKLVNTPSSGPQAEAQKKQQSSQSFASPYQQQQQTAGEPPMSAGQQYSSYQSSNSFAMHNPNSHPTARTAKPLSVTDMVVSCVSEVCKTSTAEIQRAMRSGYSTVSNYENPTGTESLRDMYNSSSSELQRAISSGFRSISTSNYETPPINGSWAELDTSQHGYGNGNKSSGTRGGGNMPARYQD